MSEPLEPSVAMIGSYVPRRCGIATFTHDLATALSDSVFRQPLLECTRIGVVAITDVDEGYPYNGEVIQEIRHHSKEDYRAAADFLNHSKFQVVCIQHEYGIYGGRDGDYLMALLNRLTKPVVAVLHTVLADPSPGQREILRKLCARSGAVVVMADRARQLLSEVFEVPCQKVLHIHHGVPDVPFGDTGPFKRRFEVAGRPTILTFGLLSPNKGVETVLDALPEVVRAHPDVAYIVLGATHPTVKRESGESYRLSLEKRALTLGIEDNVIFHNRYVSREDLCEYLRAADIYVTPYHSKSQIVSGTLAYAMACGTAVVSTPYWYAEEVLADGRGKLLGFGDVDGFTRVLCELLDDDAQRLKLRRRAYDFGRQMRWNRVAAEYARVFRSVYQTYSSRGTVEPALRSRPAMRMSLPEVRLDHLHRMTDDTGLLQHAVNATPNWNFGYSLDDVARALIVSAMRYSLFRDASVLRCFQTYLSFIHFARCQNGRYRNFMSFDRRWLESDGSDDCQGRVLWSLGYVAAHPPDDMSGKLCEAMFEKSLRVFENIQWIRSLAFAVLGCHYYLRRHPEAVQVERTMRSCSDRIVKAFRSHEANDWPWFEETVTYENGRIPQALILAGLQFHEEGYLARGMRALDWLLKVQTGDKGQVSLIGCRGWMPRGESKAGFDQQPVEIAGLIGACKAAYRVSSDRRYLAQMRRCFDWYLGSNDLGCPLIDFKSRGCYDGLRCDGVNFNQGAESLLCWLLSLMTMHDMQTGNTTSAG